MVNKSLMPRPVVEGYAVPAYNYAKAAVSG